jgi:hypothetical protein
MRVPEEIRDCVVFVGVMRDDGKTKFGGTAFWLGLKSEVTDQVYVHLVTAGHVAAKLRRRSGIRGIIRLNRRDGRAETVMLGVGTRWFEHPTDPAADVAVLPWAPESDEYAYEWLPAEMLLTDALIQEKYIGPGDDVFITGLFGHVAGHARNLPIIRTGNVAMFAPERISTKWCDGAPAEVYLIEARSIGGLSGSPVFVRETVLIPLAENPVQEMAPPPRPRIGLQAANVSGFGCYLLGLMHGHWDIPPEQKNEVLPEVGSDDLGRVNLGIAIVVPAKKILETMNHPELVERRRKEDEAIKKRNLPTMDTDAP